MIWNEICCEIKKNQKELLIILKKIEKMECFELGSQALGRKSRKIIVDTF